MNLQVENVSAKNVSAPSGLQPAASGSGLVPGYMSGFGSDFETEGLPGALPVGRNSPRTCAYGLHAERIPGSPFTATPHHQRALPALPHPTHRDALGRLPEDRPSPVAHRARPEGRDAARPLCGDPVPIPDEPLSFVEGVRATTTAGDAGAQAGTGAHLYVATRPMKDEYLHNADGGMPVVPQEDSLEGTLAATVETRVPQRVSRFAAETPALQRDYGSCGRRPTKHFDSTRPKPR